ncbi:Aldehyde dehydrogenase family 3 member B1 [Psilocybe cubensis]|uniref:Aldehyde dehydrogenase family 3 member B1 n=1 Tax=Psilocybe cubensis TaxID=181762 RepID=A0ACB8HDA1_PSICU|nr:Aldehyde dehydrogenase family 3 member B1 [Psilocybe cubensis]KAH9485988.1 Aldehyde dehydrogenase family 3 member B1 [Psilocybe cubensis]
MAKYTSFDDILNIHTELHTTFRSGKTKPYAWRHHQLLQLARFAQDNAAALAECLRLDLGRAKQEVLMGDVIPVISRSLLAAEQLEAWMAPEKVQLCAPWEEGYSASVERHPKGVVLIISPWNFPIILSLQPLYTAIAAGCCALIKPSELSHHTSSFLAQTLHKYIDPSAYRVVLGGIPETTMVLELKWDHICYTGNARVARIVSAAAAKHLTPLTLELGGKSPVIIDATNPPKTSPPPSPITLPLAARRILLGKTLNAGQICIAPDYILAPRAIIPELVRALREAYTAFYPLRPSRGAANVGVGEGGGGEEQGEEEGEEGGGEGGALKTDSLGSIISDTHFERLKALLRATRGTIVLGGNWDGKTRWMEPTVVVDVEEGDVLLDEEIFGPILPIVAVDSMDDAIAFVNRREHPLVSYIFSNDEEFKRKFISSTTSGSVWIGDTFQQVGVSQVPFGGIGESGHGRQSMKAGFDEFTYARGVVDIPPESEPFLAGRYPPYTAESTGRFEGIVRGFVIPPSSAAAASSTPTSSS